MGNSRAGRESASVGCCAGSALGSESSWTRRIHRAPGRGGCQDGQRAGPGGLCTRQITSARPAESLCTVPIPRADPPASSHGPISRPHLSEPIPQQSHREPRSSHPMTDTNVDLVVLGGGSGGYAAALRAAELGSSVVLIEKDKVGGTCLHWGCVPAKTLLHAAEVADEAREGLSIGVRTTFDGVDVPALLKYKDGIINRLYKGLTGLVKSRGIQTVLGEGRFVGPNTVVVGDDRYIGKDVVLATGSYSRTLPGLEIEGRVINSTQALSLEWIPEKAIVLGGGVIGVEFASTWASFGTEVTIVEALPTLVPLEDPWASKLLERAFRKRKITFKTGVRFQAVKQDDSGVTVSLEDGSTLTADLLLVAVGRGPYTSSRSAVSVLPSSR